MPAIATTTMLTPGLRIATRTTLGASGNTLTYASGDRSILILHNPTAGALSPVIIGSTAISAVVDQVGLPVAFNSGYACGSLAAGAQIAIPLASIDPYLRGTIDITGGTGVVATHLTF